MYSRNCKVRTSKVRKTAKFGRFLCDCLIRLINMYKINCKVRMSKFGKSLSSSLHFGRTLQFIQYFSGQNGRTLNDDYLNGCSTLMSSFLTELYSSSIIFPKKTAKLWMMTELVMFKLKRMILSSANMTELFSLLLQNSSILSEL